MNEHTHTWALVLAAGEGSRLRSLTTTASGLAVPKQFCSLSGGPSLLQDAVRRAAAVAAPERICSVVARQHRCWWHGQLKRLSPDNVIVQPENRGTAHGIMLPLLHLAVRDPEGVVVLLPADHYVRDEESLARSLREAASLARRHRDDVFLLGVEPDAPDPELGYIVPAVSDGRGATPVARFVEKPSADGARALLEQRALWNVFIIAASVRALLSLFAQQFAASLAQMQDAIRASHLTQHYQRLPNVDFSRDVLEIQSRRLRVVSAGNCGWTDLGTPQRVADTLRAGRFAPTHDAAVAASSSLSLAAQHQRLQCGARGGALRSALRGVAP